MFQIDVQAQRSALPPQGVTLLGSSLRHRVTATIIREEAAESLLPRIQNDAELVALEQVLNRYSVYWWLQHLRRVGADPAGYWRQQLGDAIQAATTGKMSTPQKKKFAWRFFRRSADSVTYELSDLNLIPL